MPAAVADSAILIGENGEVTLACLPQSAGVARRIVAAHLARWGIDALVDDAGVVVSELVANAATHTGGTRLGLTVALEHDRTVRIAVRDCSRSLPHRFSDSADQEHGRGIAVIESLSTSWGVTVLPIGKVVWARLHPGRVTGRHPQAIERCADRFTAAVEGETR